MADLHKAAAENDVATIRELIAGGANVNQTDEDGLTPLFHAARCAHGEAVEVLLGLGAEVSLWDAEGEPLMRHACEGGDATVVQILLDAGLDVGQSGAKGWTGLHEATDRGHLEVARVLLRAGADPNAFAGEWDGPPLAILAWRCGDEQALALARLLLEHGADAAATNSHGTELLMIAARGESGRAMVDLLVAHGATHTLFTAATANDVATIRALVAAGADVNEADEYGLTPLFHAAHSARPEAVKVLLDLGAEVARWDTSGEALMHWAVEDGSPETLQILLDAGADPDQRAARGWTGLHEAGLLNRPEMARVLLDAGADPNMRETDYGTTPLLLAARYVDWDDDNGERAAELVRLLVEHGADVTATDPEGRTPLDAVASAGNRELADLLLAHGATHTIDTAAMMGEAETVARLLDEGGDPNQQGRHGSTPLHHAVHYLDVVLELLRHGADPNARDTYNGTPLHSWAWGGDSDNACVAEALLAAGAQLGAVNDDGHTPLLQAAHFGFAEAVEVLLRLGADPTARSSDGLTAAEAARAEGYEDIARMIEGWQEVR